MRVKPRDLPERGRTGRACADGG